MSGSNSAGFSEAAELTDMEAVRLAQQIASERFLPLSARHYESYLEQRRRGSGPPYDRADLEPIWMELLAEAVAEVETIRDPALVKRLQDEARAVLARRYAPVQAASSPPPGRRVPGMGSRLHAPMPDGETL